MRVIVGAALLFAGVTFQGWAQTPRDVLLDVCNDTGFTVAVASAHGTDPSEARTLRSWFLVEAGQCLEGALNNVVSEQVDLHVMSGAWVWPARGGDAQYCVPANSSFQLASSPPCSGQSRERNFRRIPVELTSQRISGGRYLGRISYRIRCSDQSGNDAVLCEASPRDDRGFASPVKDLEVCNTSRSSARITAMEATQAGDFIVKDTVEVPEGECEIVYHGYPADNHLLLMGWRVGDMNDYEILCLPQDMPDIVTGGLLVDEAEICPSHAPFRRQVRSVRFGANTHRHTVYISG